jgi:anti-sigma B factor antagonist
LKISHRVVDPNIQVVAVSGRFTIGEESMQAERIVDSQLANKELRFVFDLREADFIDSSCLGILVSCLRKAKAAGGELRVVASPRVAGIIKVVRLDMILPMYTAMAAACQDFASEEESGPIGAS